MARSCRVLIVDDEILVRQGIKHLLHWEQEGFQIVGEASNGKEALEQIERMQPHIVITDIVMPVMGGAELTRVIKSQFPEIEVIILSSFGEFDYVRSTFQSGVADYILKPKLEAEQLLDILKRTARKIPSLKLEESNDDGSLSIKIVIDKLISGYEVDDDFKDITAAFPYPSYILLGADLKQLPSKSKNQHTASQWMAKIAAEFDSGLDHAVYYPVPTDPNMVVVLVNMDKSEWDRFTFIVRKLAAWTRNQQPEIGWTVGEAFSDLRQLGMNFREGFLKINAYRFFLPTSNNLIVYGELPKQSEEVAKFNMTRFTEQMNRQQFEEAFQELLRYVQAASNHYQTDVFEFKSFLGNIIFNITIVLGRLELDMKNLEEAKYAYFKSIGEASHVSEAIRLLETFIQETNAVIKTKRSMGGNPNMTMLLDYIHEHYAEPLSLTEIAKHFHFNPSYLSSYFTSHNKEGFSEYLNKIRVEKAADLLKQDFASISEISGKVGYSDHSYFTKVFKKLTGISPSQYKKIHLNKKRN